MKDDWSEVKVLQCVHSVERLSPETGCSGWVGARNRQRGIIECFFAQVVELEDTSVLGTDAFERASSTLALRTRMENKLTLKVQIK